MSIEKTVFGTLPDGRSADKYVLRNQSGMAVEVTNYGCKLLKILVPNRQGKAVDVILGHDTLQEYLGRCFQGSLVGRYANRIAGASFTIDGKEYKLEANNGKNALHGGSGGFHQVLWQVAAVEDTDTPSITFTHVSPDGDQGYPGNLTMRVVYSLSADNGLTLDYNGVCDAKTPLNFTNHSYFNLSGDHSQKVYDTLLRINADSVTEISEDLIPTGNFMPVKGTGLDFTADKPIGKDIGSSEPVIAMCGGYDHNFCVNGAGMREHAWAYCPQSGITMQVLSDLPGVQLYTFNGTPPTMGKYGVPFGPQTAFCLETQFYPDSVHHANFPFALMQPGVPFRTQTTYRFGVK